MEITGVALPLKEEKKGGRETYEGKNKRGELLFGTEFWDK